MNNDSNVCPAKSALTAVLVPMTRSELSDLVSLFLLWAGYAQLAAGTGPKPPSCRLIVSLDCDHNQKIESKIVTCFDQLALSDVFKSVDVCFTAAGSASSEVMLNIAATAMLSRSPASACLRGELPGTFAIVRNGEELAPRERGTVLGALPEARMKRGGPRRNRPSLIHAASRTTSTEKFTEPVPLQLIAPGPWLGATSNVPPVIVAKAPSHRRKPERLEV